MNKLATLLVTAAAIALASPGFAMGSRADATTEVKSEASIERDDDGGFEKKTEAEKVDATGTKTTAETKVELDVKADGDATKTTTTKETRDPKGLFNKDVVKTETKEKLEDGKLIVEHEKSINGDVVVEKKATY